jgi:hypothetical protein
MQLIPPVTEPQGAALILSGVAGSDEYVNRANAGNNPAPTGNGTGPFFSDPWSADPSQFPNQGGNGSAASGGAGSGGGSGGGGGDMFG